MIEPHTLRHTGEPDTSRAPAQRAAADLTGRKRLVLEDIRRRPMAGFELDDLYPNWPPRTGSRRLSDLIREGFVEPTGETRVTEYGSPAAVYRAVS